MLLMLLAFSNPAAAVPEDLNASLAFAAAAGTPEEVKELLAKGVKPDQAANSAGVPALSLAAQRKDEAGPAVIEELIAAGATVDIQDRKRETPLFYAAKMGSIKAIQVLLEKGASLTHTNIANVNARNLAYQEKRHESVRAMDEFVIQQNKELEKQYAERTQEYEQRAREIEMRAQEMKARNEQLASQHTQIKKLFDEKAARQAAAIKAEAARQAQKNAQERKAENKAQAEINRITQKQVNNAELQKLIFDLSYHTCAAEYWSFCRINKQETGMTREELRTQQEAHETLANEAADSMIKNFGAKEDYLNRIINPTVKQIIDDLKLHATNANRKAAGVGAKEDLAERCTDIADQWEIVGKQRSATRMREEAARKALKSYKQPKADPQPRKVENIPAAGTPNKPKTVKRDDFVERYNRPKEK